VQVFVLRKTEHHLDDEQPDFLGFVPEHLVRVRIDHLDQNLEHALQKRDMRAVLGDEHFELDCVDEFFAHGELGVVGDRHKIRPRIYEQGLYVYTQLLKVTHVGALVTRRLNVHLDLPVVLHLFIGQHSLLFKQSNPDMLIQLVQLLLKLQHVLIGDNLLIHQTHVVFHGFFIHSNMLAEYRTSFRSFVLLADPETFLGWVEIFL